MVAHVVYDAVYDVREIKNVDLPKVDEFFYEQNQTCNPKNTKTKYCSDATSTWVWECVGANIIPFWVDWHLMKGPFHAAHGLAGDGFVFIDYNGSPTEGGGVKAELFRAYKSFTPPANSDYTYTIPWENQYVMEEMTMGPIVGIRAVSFGSRFTILPLDRDNRGILCLFNKLWIHNFFFYNFDADKATSLKKLAIFEMQLLFQPVKIKRMDYMQFLIERFRCNQDACIPQNVNWLPCLSPIPYKSLDEVKDDDIIKEFKIKTVDGRSSRDIKITGKMWKEGKNLTDPGSNYIEVKVVSGPPPTCNCDELKKEIDKLKQTISDLNYNIAIKDRQINSLTKTLDTCMNSNKYLANAYKNVQEELAKAREFIKNQNEQNQQLKNTITSYENYSFNKLFGKYLRLALFKTANNITAYTQIDESSKAVANLILSDLPKISFENLDQVTELNRRITAWGDLTTILKQNISLVANILMLFNLISVNNSAGNTIYDAFNLEKVKDAHIIYRNTLYNSQYPLTLNVDVTVKEVMDSTKFFSPLQVGGEKQATQQQQDDGPVPSQQPEQPGLQLGKPRLIRPHEFRDLPIFGDDVDPASPASESTESTPSIASDTPKDLSMSTSVPDPEPTAADEKSEGSDVPMPDASCPVDDTTGGHN